MSRLSTYVLNGKLPDDMKRALLDLDARTTDGDPEHGGGGGTTANLPVEGRLGRETRRGSALNVHADDLECVLAAEPRGLSCDGLSRRLHRRRTEVLAVLQSNPRFERVGRTRRARWRLRDGMGRNDRGEPSVVVVLEWETPQSAWGAWWRT
jgi:hypothetical protein